MTDINHISDNESFHQESVQGDDHSVDYGSADQSSRQSSNSDFDSASKSSVESESEPNTPACDIESDSDWDDDVDDKWKDQSTDAESIAGDDEEATSIYEKESLVGLGSYLKESLRKHINAHERTGFVLLLACLRDCLLTHRWQEASQAVEMMCLYPTHQFDDYVWKCGLEVLYNHPDSDPVMTDHFTRKMERIHVQQRRKRLEKVFYLLSRGQFRDAEVAIRSAKILHRVGIRKGEIKNDRYWEMMTTAYSGMLKYMEWHQDRIEFTEQDACESMACVFDKPGVWDIFITKQVEILEEDGKVEDVKALLEKYCSLNEDNPNAYRYLYRHLKRNNGDQQEMITVLKEYVKRIPSDLLALDLVSLLQQTAKPKTPNYDRDICLITNTLFDMLDYHCWYGRLAPWKALARHIIKILKKRDRIAIDAAKLCWSNREWWVSCHFDSKSVKLLLKKKKNKVVLQKAMVAVVMHTTDSSFVMCVRKYFTKNRDMDSLKQLYAASKLAKDTAKLEL